MEQPPSTQADDMAEIQGVDYPSMYHVYKPKRGMKRGEESKDTYKMPHRLIEKKRRDRINECISQLKDLLPEHLKLTTLGHLEKAVVLELTLKHLNGLTSLLEQQQQKIRALQSGMPIDSPPEVRGQTEEMFRSGFHLCAKEVLSYLSANQQLGGGDHLTPPRLVSHIQTLAAEVLRGGDPPSILRPRTPLPSPPQAEKEDHHHHHHRDMPSPISPAPRAEGYRRNCVPVIRRAFAGGTPAGGQWGTVGAGGGEQSGSDTDTDSGYGGELASATAANQHAPLHSNHAHYYFGSEPMKRRSSSHFKQDGGKRPRRADETTSSEEDESLSGGESSSSSSSSLQTRPYMGVVSSGRPPRTNPVRRALLPPPPPGRRLPAHAGEGGRLVPHPERGGTHRRALPHHGLLPPHPPPGAAASSSSSHNRPGVQRLRGGFGKKEKKNCGVDVQ